MTAFHEHHRQLRRGGDDRPVNLLKVGPEVHQWIHDHPAEARELGWIVSQYEAPDDVIVTIPDSIVVKPEKKPRAKTPSNPREKKRLLVHVPADEENLLPETIEAARAHLADRMGWSEDVPDYFVLMAALASVLQT